MKMETEELVVVLSLGSNIVGCRHIAVKEAGEWLVSLLTDAHRSSIYETPPLGHSGSNYINGVVMGKFQGSVETLESLCKEYERKHGRDEEARKAKRVPIDIDIVIANGHIFREKDFNSQFFRIGFEELEG